MALQTEAELGTRRDEHGQAELPVECELRSPPTKRPGRRRSLGNKSTTTLTLICLNSQRNLSLHSTRSDPIQLGPSRSSHLAADTRELACVIDWNLSVAKWRGERRAGEKSKMDLVYLAYCRPSLGHLFESTSSLACL